jgi:hypothetical protein
MKNTKTEQLIWLFIGVLFAAGMIFFVNDSTVMVSLSVTLTSIIGIFMGLDIVNMIKRTSALPVGDFKPINKQRYIASLIIFALLLVEAFILSSVYHRNCDGLYASFGMGFLIIIGGLVNAVEGNKIVTGISAPAGTTQPKESGNET